MDHEGDGDADNEDVTDDVADNDDVADVEGGFETDAEDDVESEFFAVADLEPDSVGVELAVVE